MSENPLYACQRAVVTALKASGDAWGQQVRANRPMSGWNYPYVLIVFSGGGERNEIQRKSGDAEIVLAIKVVSDSMATAAQCNERLADLLNDMGTQSVTTGYLEAGPDWAILTSDREDFISFEERVSDTRSIYHEGARFRFMMEAV